MKNRHCSGDKDSDSDLTQEDWDRLMAVLTDSQKEHLQTHFTDFSLKPSNIQNILAFLFGAVASNSINRRLQQRTKT